MPIVLDGTSESTFSGKVSKSSLPTGSVLQVVQATYNTQTSITSTSFVASGLAATITPTSATSKILVRCSFPFTAPAAGGNHGIATLFRGTTSGTNLGAGAMGFGYWLSSGGVLYAIYPMEYLDSPATTSATTYTVAAKVSGSEAFLFQTASMGTITLMEIAA